MFILPQFPANVGGLRECILVTIGQLEEPDGSTIGESVFLAVAHFTGKTVFTDCILETGIHQVRRYGFALGRGQTEAVSDVIFETIDATGAHFRTILFTSPLVLHARCGMNLPSDTSFLMSAFVGRQCVGECP